METSDCELWGDGVLAQPVAAITSMAYVLVGALILGQVLARRWRGSFSLFALAVLAEGVGSVLFHARGGDLAQVLHDAPLVAMLGFIAGWHLARSAGGSVDHIDRGAVVGLAAGSVLGVVGAISGTTATMSIALGALVLVGELFARRRGAPAVWTAGLVVLLGISAASWWLGWTGGPVCDPVSDIQPHGAWHVLSALVALTWAERASIVLDPVGAPRIWRIAVDAVIGVLARGLSYAFYRSVDVMERDRIPWGRPMLIVANHANGFVDPVLVASALGRLPRFMAKAALWRVPIARPFLALAGVLPVYRRSDGDDPHGNESVFASCHAEHARGGIVAIFPEGTTGDRAALDRVRSGAARIALGSVAVAPKVVVVPVGLAFENRTETRGRALVVFGPPVEPRLTGRIVDGEPPRSDVDRLTDEITASLQAISPEFASVDERDLLRAAAGVRVALDRGRGGEFGEIELLARRMATAPEEERSAVGRAYADYAARLQLIELRDRQLRGGSTSWRRLLGSALVVGALGSIVLTATLVHLPALLLTWTATAAVRSTATKGTVRVLVGLATGVVTWVAFGVVVADGWGAVLAGLTIAAQGALALVVVPPLLRWVDDLWGRITMRDRAALLPPVLESREVLGGAVDRALTAAVVPTIGAEPR